MSQKGEERRVCSGEGRRVLARVMDHYRIADDLLDLLVVDADVERFFEGDFWGDE